MGIFGSFHSFVRGVYVGFVCCAGILIFLLSSFQIFFSFLSNFRNSGVITKKVKSSIVSYAF